MELLAATLGMPPGSEWVHIWCVDKVAERQPATLYFQRSAHSGDDTAYRFTLSPDEARPMAGFTFDLFGRIADEPTTPLYWQFSATGGLDHEVRVEVWWLEVPIGTGLRALRTYEPLAGTDRRLVEVTGAGWEEHAGKVKRGLKALDMIVTKPGPKEGTVKAQKYKTRPEWLAALRERVLTRRTRVTAEDWQSAEWLGISTSQLYALMKRWGPPRTLNDLRESNF